MLMEVLGVRQGRAHLPLHEAQGIDEHCMVLEARKGGGTNSTEHE